MSATARVHEPTPGPTPPAAPTPAGPARRRGSWRAVVAVGVGLRLVVLFGPLGRPDSDEVIAGLMARHLGSDGLPAFFWGQHYGGTIEALPVAISLTLFGTSVAGPAGPDAAARRGQRGAGVAVRPPADERGQRPGRRPAGLGVAAGRRLVRHPRAALLRADGHPRPRRRAAGPAPAATADRDGATGRWWLVEWAGLGAALGLGWWTSPNIVLLRGAGRGGAAAAAGPFRRGSRCRRGAACSSRVGAAVADRPAVAVGQPPVAPAAVAADGRDVPPDRQLPRAGPAGSSPTGCRPSWASGRSAPSTGCSARSAWSPTSPARSPWPSSWSGVLRATGAAGRRRRSTWSASCCSR